MSCSGLFSTRAQKIYILKWMEYILLNKIFFNFRLSTVWDAASSVYEISMIDIDEAKTYTRAWAQMPQRVNTALLVTFRLNTNCHISIFSCGQNQNEDQHALTVKSNESSQVALK